MGCFIGAIIPEDEEIYGRIRRSIIPSDEENDLFEKHGGRIVEELRGHLRNVGTLRDVEVELKSIVGAYIAISAQVDQDALYQAATQGRGGDVAFLKAQLEILGDTLQDVMQRKFNVKDIERRRL